MSKPTPETLNPTNYPIHVTIPTRWVDMNMAAHLSNIAIVEMFEEARERFYHKIGLEILSDDGVIMIVSNEIDYIAEGFWPHDLEIYCKVEKIGNSSFQIRQLALQNGAPIATCLLTSVNTKNGKSAPLPALIRGKLL